MPSALFELDGPATFVPQPETTGPWSPDALHGGPTAALLAGVAESAGEDASEVAMLPARLSVELLKPVPLAPLHASAEVVRPGRKVQLVDARLTTEDGTIVATARLLRIRTTDLDVPVTSEATPHPLPDTIRPTRPAAPWTAYHREGIEQRYTTGEFMQPGPATAWFRLNLPVRPDRPTTPLERVAAAADFGNGISSVADWETTSFINPDLTIHLHRLPEGEWVAVEAVTWMERNGTALAESRLWDERGLLGRSLQSLLVDQRRFP